MNLFSLDIVDFMTLPTGGIEEFMFTQDIDPETFGEVVCTQPLMLNIKLVRQDYGIECIFVAIETVIDIPSEGLTDREISLHHLSREFHLKKSPSDTDDIGYIDEKEGIIDLTQSIEEELLIAGL